VKVFVLVEGTSEQALLERWAPRAFPGHQFLLRPHQGKGTLPRSSRKPDPRQRGLLDQLPATLGAYAASCGEDEAVLVLVDADDDDCRELKRQLVALAGRVAPTLRVSFRIAVEETEAFYFGDLRALKAAFPDADHTQARAFVPDSRPAKGTAETFADIVGDDTLRKRDWGQIMGDKLTIDPAKSRSESFKALHDGIRKLVAPGPRPKQRRAKHWKVRHSSQRRTRRR
jgi:Domain of unknown function (DUF4276)